MVLHPHRHHIPSLIFRDTVNNQVLTDGSEALSDFCAILERTFNHNFKNRTVVLGETRYYFSFFQAALKRLKKVLR
jgi:hypothetical protein